MTNSLESKLREQLIAYGFQAWLTLDMDVAGYYIAHKGLFIIVHAPPRICHAGEVLAEVHTKDTHIRVPWCYFSWETFLAERLLAHCEQQVLAPQEPSNRIVTEGWLEFYLAEKLLGWLKVVAWYGRRMFGV